AAPGVSVFAPSTNAPPPLGGGREGVEIEKSRTVRAVDVDCDIVDAERAINVGDEDCSAAPDRRIDLGGGFPARPQKRTRVLAGGLWVAIELLGAEVDQPGARKQPSFVEPPGDVR